MGCNKMDQVFDNIYVGVDIEGISRFKEISNNKTFLDKVYSKKELEYCLNKKSSEQHLAVRFAAKEAIIKALSSYKKEILPMNKVEILSSTNGAPYVNIEGYNIKLSLSHCKDKAIAFAIIIGK